MKRNTLWAVPIFVLLTLSATAQMNSREGHMYKSASKSDNSNDTASVYHDDPNTRAHQEVRVIKRSGPKSKAPHIAANHLDTASIDTTAETAAVDTAASDVTVARSEAVDAVAGPRNFNDCDCANISNIYAALGLFGLAGLSSVFLLSLIGGDDKKFLLLAITDVVLAAAGMPLLVVFTIYEHGPLFSLLLLILAILFGMYILFHEARGKPIPKWMVGLHIALSFIGFVMLLIFAIGH